MSNKFYVLNNPMPKGVIFLCNHGLNGSEENFTGTLTIINQLKDQLKVITYLNSFLYHKFGLDNSIYVDLKENAKNYTDKMIFIRTRFADARAGDLDDQAKELDTMIDNILACLGDYKSSYEIVLIGHSKGGLVNMEYALEHTTKVRKLISINTPYNGALFWMNEGWGVLDWNMNPQIVKLGNKWNDTVYFMRPKLACIASNKDNSGNDGLVGNDSAFGEPVKNIYSDYNRRTYKGITNKSLIEGKGDSFSHAGCLGNEELVYCLLLNIQKLFADESGSTGGSKYPSSGNTGGTSSSIYK